MNSHSDTTLLYVTEDIYSESFFARTDADKFARFHKVKDMWFVWIYPYKKRYFFSSLSETLQKIDSLYKDFWRKTYDRD